MNLLIFVEFNLINCGILFLLLIVMIIHFFNTIKSEKVFSNEVYLKMHKYWSFFLVIVALVALMRYLYQFMAFDLIYEQLLQQLSFNYINEHGKIIGLAIYETICFEEKKKGNSCLEDSSKLRLGFLPDLFLLFFTLIVKNYLKMVVIYEKNERIANSPLYKRTSSFKGFNSLKLKTGDQDMNKIIKSKSYESVVDETASRKEKKSEESPWNRFKAKKTALQKKFSFMKKEYMSDINHIFNEYINFNLSSM